MLLATNVDAQLTNTTPVATTNTESNPMDTADDEFLADDGWGTLSMFDFETDMTKTPTVDALRLVPLEPKPK
jgi:hypothetical protein